MMEIEVGRRRRVQPRPLWCVGQAHSPRPLLLARGMLPPFSKPAGRLLLLQAALLQLRLAVADVPFGQCTVSEQGRNKGGSITFQCTTGDGNAADLQCPFDGENCTKSLCSGRGTGPFRQHSGCSCPSCAGSQAAPPPPPNYPPPFNFSTTPFTNFSCQCTPMAPHAGMADCHCKAAECSHCCNNDGLPGVPTVKRCTHDQDCGMGPVTGVPCCGTCDRCVDLGGWIGTVCQPPPPPPPPPPSKFDCESGRCVIAPPNSGSGTDLSTCKVACVPSTFVCLQNHCVQHDGAGVNRSTCEELCGHPAHPADQELSPMWINVSAQSKQTHRASLFVFLRRAPLPIQAAQDTAAKEVDATTSAASMFNASVQPVRSQSAIDVPLKRSNTSNNLAMTGVLPTRLTPPYVLEAAAPAVTVAAGELLKRYANADVASAPNDWFQLAGLARNELEITLRDPYMFSPGGEFEAAVPSQRVQHHGDPYPGGPGQCSKSDGAWHRNGTLLEACVIAVVNWRGSLPPAEVNISTYDSNGGLIVTDIASDGVSILRYPAANQSGHRGLMFASAEYREAVAGVKSSSGAIHTIVHQATTTARLNRSWTPEAESDPATFPESRLIKPAQGAQLNT